MISLRKNRSNMELLNTFRTPFLYLVILLLMNDVVINVVAKNLCDFEKLSPCKSGFNACAERSYEVQTEEYQQSRSYQDLSLETTVKFHESTKPTNEATTTPQCGPFMVYTTCTCHGSCQDPTGCLTICTAPVMCVCMEGFLINGADCVVPEQCGCYLEEAGILLEGHVYVNADCTQRVSCINDQLIWDENYVCSPHAICDTRDSVRQCYCSFGSKGDGLVCNFFLDCFDLYNDGNTVSGSYYIKPTGWPLETPFEVYCDMSDGGGWTVFQRRKDGSIDFYRNWYSYKEGFGPVTQEFWLGNDKLYYLTNQKQYIIKFDLVNAHGSPFYARYDSFRINNEVDNYRLIELGHYTGTADKETHSNPPGYAFSYHLSNAFSTYDKDNDQDDDTNCAEYQHGAWWFGIGTYNCHSSSLNGDYFAESCSPADIDWYWLPDNDCSLKSTQMKIRPA